MATITAASLKNAIDTMKAAYGRYNVEVKINKDNNIVVIYFDGIFCIKATFESYFAVNDLRPNDNLILTNVETHFGFTWEFYGTSEGVVENIF